MNWSMRIVLFYEQMLHSNWERRFDATRIWDKINHDGWKVTQQQVQQSATESQSNTDCSFVVFYQ